MKTKKQSEFWFDRDAADKVVEFFSEYIRHTKGEWAGDPFVLQKWQEKYIRELFGWKRSDGTRKYRTTYWEIPRKNGKSFLASAVGLYLLFSDGEPGAEIYSAAADRDQAAIVFDVAREIVAASPALAKRAEIYRRAIVVNGSSYKVLSADANTKFGYSVHGLMFDELMTQPNRFLWDALTTASGARRQPLIFAISTAGFDKHSICWEIHEYAEKVLDGSVNDPSFLPVMFGATEEDDWTSPKVWKKANPSYGVTVKADYIKQECERAKVTPAYENTFRRLLLDQWTEQETRWLQMSIWDKGNALPFNAAALKGRRCYGGLDLSDSNDLTAFVLVFPPDKIPFKDNPVVDRDNIDRIDFAALDGEPFYVLPFFWIPEDNMRARVKSHHVPYDLWQDRGFIMTTPGNSIDHRRVAIHMEKMRLEYDLRGVYFDPYGSRKITADLVEDYGFTLDVDEGKRYQKPWLLIAPQTYTYWTPVLNDIVNFLQAGKLAHGENPVLRWNASNAVIEEGKYGGKRLAKKKSREKIDGIVAMAMGLEAAIANANEIRGSVYDQRDMRSL